MLLVQNFPGTAYGFWGTKEPSQATKMFGRLLCLMLRAGNVSLMWTKTQKWQKLFWMQSKSQINLIICLMQIVSILKMRCGRYVDLDLNFQNALWKVCGSWT